MSDWNIVGFKQGHQDSTKTPKYYIYNYTKLEIRDLWDENCLNSKGRLMEY